jgi:hypothetical protein
VRCASRYSGWSCWLNNTGAADRRRGLALDLIGIEGDDGHVRFALKSLAPNGFLSNESELSTVLPHRGDKIL